MPFETEAANNKKIIRAMNNHALFDLLNRKDSLEEQLSELYADARDEPEEYVARFIVPAVERLRKQLERLNADINRAMICASAARLACRV